MSGEQPDMAKAKEILDDFAEKWSDVPTLKPRKKYKRFGIYPMAQKPLSPRRAREFKDRTSKQLFGTRRERAGRWQYLMDMCRTVPEEMVPPWLSKVGRYGTPAKYGRPSREPV